jgi:hypothetical protein
MNGQTTPIVPPQVLGGDGTKRAYKAPSLTKLGSVRELTLGTSTGTADRSSTQKAAM